MIPSVADRDEWLRIPAATNAGRGGVKRLGLFFFFIHGRLLTPVGGAAYLGELDYLLTQRLKADVGGQRISFF